MKRFCVSVCLCVAVIAASQVQATNEHSLSSPEAWSTYGGGNSKCWKGMGRCYANPAWANCDYQGETACTGSSIVKSVVDTTCEDAPSDTYSCTEKGQQVRCIKTTTCEWVDTSAPYNPGGVCKINTQNWSYVGNDMGGDLGTEGDDCSAGPPSTPPAYPPGYPN